MLYHCIFKIKAAMDQFLEGLEAGGVLGALRNHSDVMKSMFCPTEKPKLTAGLQCLGLGSMVTIICLNHRCSKGHVGC